jgi:ketosteroid isomerase-like protein
MDAGVSAATPDMQDIVDEHEIVKVALRYCRALDTKDWQLLDDVFMVDATADLAAPSPLVGIEAIRARIRAALENLDLSQHLVGNHEVSVDGDTAVHRCYLQAQHVRRAASGGPNYIVAGRYEDRLVRTERGWRIVHRTLVVMWTEGNLAVARGD